MAKNRVQTHSRLLADIVLKPRSRAYKDLLEMCWDNETQSDASAAQLRDELKSTLVDLLQAQNLDAINQKLNDRAPSTAAEILRLSDKPDKTPSTESLLWKKEKLALGKQSLFLEKGFRSDATPEQIVYGVLRRSIESGDIERLGLCECGKLFYRAKSLKQDFCGTQCRWDFHNHSERRKRQRVGGVWIKKKDLR